LTDPEKIEILIERFDIEFQSAWPEKERKNKLVERDKKEKQKYCKSKISTAKKAQSGKKEIERWSLALVEVSQAIAKASKRKNKQDTFKEAEGHAKELLKKYSGLLNRLRQNDRKKLERVISHAFAKIEMEFSKIKNSGD